MLFSPGTALLTLLPLLTTASASPQAFVSTSDLSHKLSATDPPVSGPGTPPSSTTSTWSLTFDDSPSTGYRQTIRGFGAAVTDATVAVLNALPSAQLDALLATLFAAQNADSANFALVRHTIAASDLSADPAYTYDDNNNAQDTPSLDGFSLGDRGTAMAQLLARIQALNPSLTTLGSAWSPPGWMKLNRALFGTTDSNNLDHAYASHYAQYFVRYLSAYAEHGASVNAITIQNEPLMSKAGFPTMYVYADEAGALIRDNVGPALRDAGFGDVAVWAYDHNTDEPTYPQTVLDTAPAFVPAVAWHCYAPNNDWAVLSAFHDSNPAIEQIMTECWTSSGNITPWNQASGFTIGPLQNWATGALAWGLATDTSDGPFLSGDGACATCRGLVVVDTAAGTYELQVDYFMMAQFSRFMPKGGVVLSGTGSWTYDDGGGVQAVASANPDGTRTVVMENTFANDVYVSVGFGADQWSGLLLSQSVTSWVL